MAIFFGSYENKIDRKGRVSVPAPFRQALASQPVPRIVAFCSFRADAIEASSTDFMEDLKESLNSKDLFSDEHDHLATAIFASCFELPFDAEGRIILPSVLTSHAGISDRAAFVGKGQFFQIWNPEALQSHVEDARARARSQGLTLKLRSKNGGGE